MAAAFWRARTARTDSRTRHRVEQKRFPGRSGTNNFRQSGEAHSSFATLVVFFIGMRLYRMRLHVSRKIVCGYKPVSVLICDRISTEMHRGAQLRQFSGAGGAPGQAGQPASAASTQSGSRRAGLGRGPSCPIVTREGNQVGVTEVTRYNPGKMEDRTIRT